MVKIVTFFVDIVTDDIKIYLVTGQVMGSSNPNFRKPRNLGEGSVFLEK